MIGRPKKEDCREKQYRVRLNEKEDDMLTFASNAIGIPKSEIFRNALREYSEKIKLRQAAEEIGDGATWNDDRIGLQHAVECPYCKAKNRVDLKGEETASTSERQMGSCEAKHPTICRGCSAVLEAGTQQKFCPACREKRKAKWIEHLKVGAKIVGIIGVAVGAAYFATRESGASDESADNFEPESSGDDSGRKFRLLIKYADGTEEEEDEFFDSEEEAKEYGDYMISCSREGAETLYMSNPGDYPLENYDDPDYEVIEAE